MSLIGIRSLRVYDVFCDRAQFCWHSFSLTEVAEVEFLSSGTVRFVSSRTYYIFQMTMSFLPRRSSWPNLALRIRRGISMICAAANNRKGFFKVDFESATWFFSALIREQCFRQKIKIPKIYYGTRTHAQIEQIVRELKKTCYKHKK